MCDCISPGMSHILCNNLWAHSSLLSKLQKRKLDAVYYYMRSLAASNPILTAKESLMSLFEEAKRKVRNTFGQEGTFRKILMTHSH